MWALRGRRNHRAAGGIGRPPGAAAAPELEVELCARDRALDPAPGVLDIGAQRLWHGLPRIRSKPAQDPLRGDGAGKPRPDRRPDRPKGPAPAAHRITDVIKLQKARVRWAEVRNPNLWRRLRLRWGLHPREAPSLCLAFPPAPATTSSTVLVLLFLKVIGIDSSMGLPLWATVLALEHRLMGRRSPPWPSARPSPARRPSARMSGTPRSLPRL
jgi:hypothetical protein